MNHTHAGTFGRLCCCALGALCSLALSSGCSGDGDATFPFGADAGPQATSDAPVTSESSSTQGEGSTADGSATSGTDGGGADETTMAADASADADATGDPGTEGGTTESTGSTGDPRGSTTGETTAATDATTGDDGMGDPGVQPGAGMYSECSMFDACQPLVDPICLSTGPVFGFCTVACNASNECDAPPGDTTTAICDPTLSYCMLDCSTGSCPIGLDCIVGDLGGGVVSRCLEQ